MAETGKPRSEDRGAITRNEIHQRFTRVVARVLAQQSVIDEDKVLPQRRPGGIPDDEEAYERMVREAYL